MFNDVLIMAGGSGTRLWPASSSRLPKQFLPAEKGISFFSMAVKRALAVTKKNGRVIIITGKSHIPHVINNCAVLNAEEKKRLLVIGEPAAKNTAPAIACAAALSNLSGNKRSMLVITSDHIIKPLNVFKKDAALAAKAADYQSGNLVVFGITPSRPDTGYGYIEIKKNNAPENFFTVSAFHEKPDAQTAAKYTEDTRFFWNSGMFAFNSSFIIDQFFKLAKDVFRPFANLRQPKPADFTAQKGIKILKTWQGLENAYKKTKNISFDYAITEKCEKTVMVKANFDWIDIGNWEEYAKICKKTDSLVFESSDDNCSNSCHIDSDIPVALAGVKDLIVVIRTGKNGEPAAALITKKGQTQKVRDAVNLIKKAGKTELL